MVFGKWASNYAVLWKAVIRPPRDTYEIEDLGPQLFELYGRIYIRNDFDLKNKRGMTLKCSHYEPILASRTAERLPCVVYLHGNSSSRCEVLPSLPQLLPMNLTVFCFDFAGSGQSDGEYLSLGYYEKDDLACVIDHLRESKRVSTIGLWGRSMGAATALLHGHRDPSIAAMVLDSPFTDLKTLAKELVDVYVSVKIPKFLVSVVLGMVRNSIRKEAHFDIADLNPLSFADKSFIPALFIAAKEDRFIKPHHAKTLHRQYAGDKNLVMVDGDHNSQRPSFVQHSVAFFFLNALDCGRIPSEGSCRAPPLQAASPCTQNSRSSRFPLVGRESIQTHIVFPHGGRTSQDISFNDPSLLREERRTASNSRLASPFISTTSIPSPVPDRSAFSTTDNNNSSDHAENRMHHPRRSQHQRYEHLMDDDMNNDGSNLSATHNNNLSVTTTSAPHTTSAVTTTTTVRSSPLSQDAMSLLSAEELAARAVHMTPEDLRNQGQNRSIHSRTSNGEDRGEDRWSSEVNVDTTASVLPAAEAPSPRRELEQTNNYEEIPRLPTSPTFRQQDALLHAFERGPPAINVNDDENALLQEAIVLSFATQAA